MENNYSSDMFDIVIADTIGACTPKRVQEVLEYVPMSNYMGVHLHTDSRFEDVVGILLDRGIRKFDSSMLGIGGCPYAKSDAAKGVGNISTLPLVKFLHSNGYDTGIDMDALEYANKMVRYWM